MHDLVYNPFECTIINANVHQLKFKSKLGDNGSINPELAVDGINWKLCVWLCSVDLVHF